MSLTILLLLEALAQACDVAEQLRLTEEQEKLAARNAWTGVERAFEALGATKCELAYDNLFLGAESARYLGKVYEQNERLKLALAVAPEMTEDGSDPRPGITSSIEAIEGSYSRVEIKGDPRRRPVLSRAEMPFAPDQRKAIEWAITVVAETGSFKGMLPFGDYVVGTIEFSVAQSPDWQVVTVGKVKGEAVARAPTSGGIEGSAELGGTTTESAGRYAGLVATAGPGFLTTPEPGKSFTLADGDDAFAPSAVFLSGFGLQAGAELGLTYAEPALGAAVVLGYQGGFGTDTFNLLSGWLAGVARPGNARIALGPMYQVALGRGTGVASWFDRGHDRAADPNDAILYEGASWGGGVQGALGYGLLDLEPLQGLIEIGGAWQNDGHRNYYTFGLRVGLVPFVPRFEG
jgi:hypothetical protein